jgi:phosphoenolpyruvate carboxylase
MNYGLISAVLLNKIALSKLYELQEEFKIDTYPIIDGGSAPFRGNLRPYTVDRVVKEYLAYGPLPYNPHSDRIQTLKSYGRN